MGGSYWLTFFPAIVVLGLGLAISVAPLTTTVMNSVSTAYAGAASGINNAAARIAGLLAVALFGAIMIPIFNRNLHDRLDGVDIAPAVMEALERQRSKLAAIELSSSVDPRSRTAAELAIEQAFVAGFRWIMLVSALFALAGAASAWALIGSANRRVGGDAPP